MQGGLLCGAWIAVPSAWWVTAMLWPGWDPPDPDPRQPGLLSHPDGHAAVKSCSARG